MTDLQENYGGLFDGRVGFGDRPALLLIDFVKAYTTPGAPLYAPGVVEAVARTVPLVALAREASVPVIFTKVLFHPSGQDGGWFVRKVPVLRSFVPGEPLTEIVAELPVAEDDLVLVKNYASAFFATSLAATLTARGIDTLLLAGCSTSGCVRATAVDGLQHGFRVIVPRDCVGDRHPAPHEANLFDINAKYGDVLPLETVMSYLRELSGRAD
ncbi:N-carbamoylsarcosine amidohydrolase [Algihabitans albus]|uniref:N-carbamoylsarcosine amidohydrolase n=1 Tax=Algihabitans albus TaxID=2164067 RepID=UPI000E5D2D83|nr:N-carbamoylsarcosine amidohydrolase [Algihabitans albus]